MSTLNDAVAARSHPACNGILKSWLNMRDSCRQCLLSSVNLCSYDEKGAVFVGHAGLVEVSRLWLASEVGELLVAETRRPHNTDCIAIEIHTVRIWIGLERSLQYDGSHLMQCQC